MDFAECLFSELDCSIYVMSHAGMVNNCPSGDSLPDTFTLAEQSSQKADILEELKISEHPNLIFISHSIGSRIMLNLMSNQVKLGIG